MPAIASDRLKLEQRPGPTGPILTLVDELTGIELELFVADDPREAARRLGGLAVAIETMRTRMPVIKAFRPYTSE